MANKIPFEQALGDLEKLVEEMEKGAMGLEEMVGAFEKGQKLVKECNARLDEVENRIKVIRDGGKIEDLPPLNA